jgi:hypothetical protein
MALASYENQLASKREEKTSSFYKKILEEQQITIHKQNQTIDQLTEAKISLSIVQQQLDNELQELRKQHERTLSAFN